MDANSYQGIKEYIFNKLNKIQGALPKNAITSEIEAAQTVISSVGLEIFAKILSIDNFSPLLTDDWERLKRDLETHFDVKMENGVLIQGEEQQKRDSLWWTSIEKQNGENYYWDRYHAYLEKSLPPEVVETIDVDTDIIMDNIENPYVPSFSRYGMVVGHVQSGKTGNYSALVCKAADAEYKFIVIIAGGINNLRSQTQERLNESFIGQTKGIQVGSGKGNTNKKSMPLSLTTIERDFNKQDADRLAQGINFDNISVPILLVIKKNTKTLENVIDWLEKQYKNKVSNHAMLVIDDESDYASINTKEEEDPTAINKKLRKLLSLFQKSSYVAYTATPYANIFIDHKAENEDLGRDLFPKDFIYALKAPTNYFGAKKIFLDSDNYHLVPINDYNSHVPPNHKMDFNLTSLPPSMHEAMRLFILNIGIRHLRGYGNKHNSMLIHATRFTDTHSHLARLVSSYLKKLKSEVISFGNLSDALLQSKTIRNLKETFEKRHKNIEFNWETILQKLTEIIEGIIVREVHQKTSIPLEYRNDQATNVIVIGGTSVSRGYTLEGLNVSYFLRNTVFYDTLMQMGRWFGYRPGYEDLCRIYMPEERIDDFGDIIRATEELFNDFRIMAEMKKTPNDFGLAVQENPNSALQITARNKQKNVREFYLSMRLDGKLKETSNLSMNPTDIKKNISAVTSLIDKLKVKNQTNSTVIWRDIDKTIIQAFLEEFETVENDKLGLKARMPLAFIKKFAEERETKWDVALFNGTGAIFSHNGISIQKEKRQFHIKNNYYEVLNRQVSSGNSESIALDDPNKIKEIGNDRLLTRSVMSRPLLMLHILEQKLSEDQQDLIPIDQIAAFGISFPGSVLSKEDTIKLKINTVYYENLLKELEYEKEIDD
jgi:hypothetical protein